MKKNNLRTNRIKLLYNINLFEENVGFTYQTYYGIQKQTKIKSIDLKNMEKRINR